MHRLRTLLALLALVATAHAADLDPPLVVGDLTLLRYAEGSYEDAQGRTYYSGAAEPSQADAAAAVATPAVAPVVAPVPAEVGAGQIRAAMIATGIAADVEALDALITTALETSVPDATQRAVALALWRHASAFKRDNAFVEAARLALNKTPAEIDALFRLAATF
jgi:hypothetical protein